jgi:hypothetical protein
MQLFALAYLTAGLITGAVIHPIAGLTMLAAPAVAGRLT